MPGKDQVEQIEWAATNAYEEIHRQIKEDNLSRRNWCDDNMQEKIWVSPDEREKIDRVSAQLDLDTLNHEYQKQMKDLIKNERTRSDPVERLRNEMREELNDIKGAINKIGIMLDSEAPTTETLEKHKTLREAYRKYKMIEALTLGNQE